MSDLLDTQFKGCRALAAKVVADKLDTGCYLLWQPGDAPAVRPSGVGREEAWEVCCDGSGLFDVWYVGSRRKQKMIVCNLSLGQAALRFKKVSPANIMREGGSA